MLEPVPLVDPNTGLEPIPINANALIYTQYGIKSHLIRANLETIDFLEIF